MGKAEAHQQVWIKQGTEEPGRRGEDRAREEAFESSLVKGPDTPCDKRKIIEDFEPVLTPPSVRGINICHAEQCTCEVGTLGGQAARCSCLSPPPLGICGSTTSPPAASSVLLDTYPRYRTAETVIKTSLEVISGQNSFPPSPGLPQEVQPLCYSPEEAPRPAIYGALNKDVCVHAAVASTTDHCVGSLTQPWKGGPGDRR